MSLYFDPPSSLYIYKLNTQNLTNFVLFSLFLFFLKSFKKTPKRINQKRKPKLTPRVKVDLTKYIEEHSFQFDACFDVRQ